jgi:hypothetical protein
MLLAAVIAAALCDGRALGAADSAPAAGIARIKLTQRRVLAEGELARLRRARELAKHHGRRAAGVRSRRTREEELAPLEREAPGTRPAWMKQRFESWRAQQALKTNVRANNRNSDLVLNATQAEEVVAAWHQYVLIAWNDGEHAGAAAPANDILGYGFSSDSGATFTDGGVPPKGTNWTWVSDPLVTVNEKTGKFYFCSLVDSTSSFNGVGIVSATFAGTVLTWGSPVMLRKVSTSPLVLDKQWAVADSSSDSVYVSYTTFTPFGNFGSDHIQFQRSANGTSWSPAVTLSAATDSGVVQGSRPAVGPNGEVYVVWSALGPTDVDFFRIRKSTNAGGIFGSEVTIPNSGVPSLGYYGNFGTGGPGFNRGRGITFPSIAVDRSAGAYRGRVYVTWNESINFYDDIPPFASSSGAKSEPAGETNANDKFASATSFTVGNAVRGAFGSASDFDYWKFNATAGQTGVFYMDSTNGNLDVAFRLFCVDTLTRIAFSNFGQGSGGLLVFTFPATGTYYLRCADFNGSLGGYHIFTKFSTTGTERARDHRDIFVTSSANGVSSWSTPVRVNGDPANLDDWLPEVAVSAQGKAYVAWYDWRDSVSTRCAGISNVYLARSDDGGGSWIEVGQVSDAPSDWTNNSSNLAPNQGDYISLYANEIGVYPAWADARNGDPDVYTVYLPLLVTPVQASLLSAEAAPDRVTLAWYASEATGLIANVYRRGSETSDWAAIAQVVVPENGRVVHVDPDVTPGARYQYRLGIVEGGVESFFGEAWVDVPLRRLALSAIAPNPTARDLWVSFVLPTSAPATLRLYDVAGREVRSRDVGGAAGVRPVNLGEGGLLPMGVYVVRLTQGGKTVSARVSVVR